MNPHRKEHDEAKMGTLIVASFNVNGIRARLPLLLEWLKARRPDVVCIQETKVQDRGFPQEVLEGAGYRAVFRGEKAFNGVAVLSRHALSLVRSGFDDPPEDGDRLMIVALGGLTILNTYVPQGTAPDSDRFQYKLDWFRRLGELMERELRPDDPVLWAGDFNVAPEPKDVYDPERLRGEIGFHPAEHQALERIRRWGWVDVFRRHVQRPKEYTFWDYRIPQSVARGLGWRLDHIWATRKMAEKSVGAWIDMGPRRAPRPSDHTPILAEFDLP